MGERKYNKELKSELLNEISALTLAVQELTNHLSSKGDRAPYSSKKLGKALGSNPVERRSSLGSFYHQEEREKLAEELKNIRDETDRRLRNTYGCSPDTQARVVPRLLRITLDWIGYLRKYERSIPLTPSIREVTDNTQKVINEEGLTTRTCNDQLRDLINQVRKWYLYVTSNPSFVGGIDDITKYCSDWLIRDEEFQQIDKVPQIVVDFLEYWRGQPEFVLQKEVQLKWEELNDTDPFDVCRFLKSFLEDTLPSWKSRLTQSRRRSSLGSSKQLGKELGFVWGTGVSVDHCRFYDEVITAQKAISNLSTSPDWKIRPGMEILNVDVKNEDIAIVVTKALAGGLRDKFSRSVAVSPSIEEEVAKVFDDRRDKKTRMRDFLSALGRWEYELYPRLKAVLDKRDSSGRTLHEHLQQIPKNLEPYTGRISTREDLSVANNIVTNRINEKVKYLKTIEEVFDVGVLTPSIKKVCDSVSEKLRFLRSEVYLPSECKLRMDMLVNEFKDTVIEWMIQLYRLERKLSASPQTGRMKLGAYSNSSNLETYDYRSLSRLFAEIELAFDHAKNNEQSDVWPQLKKDVITILQKFVDPDADLGHIVSREVTGEVYDLLSDLGVDGGEDCYPATKEGMEAFFNAVKERF